MNIGLKIRGKNSPNYLPGFKLELRHTSLSKLEMRKHAYFRKKLRVYQRRTCIREKDKNCNLILPQYSTEWDEER